MLGVVWCARVRSQTSQKKEGTTQVASSPRKSVTSIVPSTCGSWSRQLRRPTAIAWARPSRTISPEELVHANVAHENGDAGKTSRFSPTLNSCAETPDFQRSSTAGWHCWLEPAETDRGRRDGVCLLLPEEQRRETGNRDDTKRPRGLPGSLRIGGRNPSSALVDQSGRRSAPSGGFPAPAGSIRTRTSVAATRRRFLRCWLS